MKLFLQLQSKIKHQYKAKRTFLFASFVLIGSSLALLSNSSGPASAGNGGRTGAPGDAGNCSNCHGGGVFSPSTLISVFDAGTTTPVTSYIPGTTYDVQVTVSSSTGIPKFGFQMTSLTSANIMAGTYSSPSANAKISTSGARNYLEHNATSLSGTFTAQWTAPSAGTGSVSFYAFGNCVNGTGGTSGDNAVGTTLTISEAVACTPTASTINDTICSGNSYTFNGVAQTTAGTYLDTMVNAGGCDSIVTLNLTVNTTPAAPVVTNDSICAPGGTVNLLATGFNVQWYDQLLGGNLINSGNTYTPNISSNSTYYVTQEGGNGGTASMPAQTGIFSGNSRGYWFTAPTNFTITSLKVPTTASSGNQSIAVLKFTGNTPPPVFSSTTNAFTTLFITQNNTTAGNISVNIPVQAGEVIGILGVRNDVNSYSNTGNTITINGNTVTLSRLGMQYTLSNTLPQNLWTESGNISRVEFDYMISNGCFSSPRVPVIGVVNPLPNMGTVSATPSTICIGDSSKLKITSIDPNIWVTTPIAYTNSGVYNSPNYLSCSSITIPSTTTIDGFWLENSNMGASTYANIALYSDVAGSPSIKIIQGTQQNNMSNGYVFFPIANTVLNPGSYWVAVNTSGNFSTFYNLSLPSIVKTKLYSEMYNAIFPATITAPPNYSVTGNAPAVGIHAVGTPSLAYAWSPSASVANANLDSTMAFPSATTIYTVTATNAAGCTSTSSVTVTNNSTGGLAQATTNNVASTTGSSNQTYTQNDGATHTYTDGSCNIIATVNDGAGGNVLGATSSSVIVDGTVQSFNGQPYARRHYTITPTNQGPATITLYLTQADFDDYNANNGLFPDLPTGPTDVAGIANVRITQVHGNGVLGVDPAEVITPILTWDATNLYWMATFNVTSFSSFYFHAVNPNNSALPVTLLSFTGRKLTTQNELQWVTSMEQNNAYFNVQRSANARDFVTIGKMASKAVNGNSNVLLQYELQDEHPLVGHNYYRLIQVDNDNRTTTSQLIDLYRDAQGNVVNVYPNPTRSVIQVECTLQEEGKLTIQLLDMSGRVIKETNSLSNKTQIDMSDVSVGMYQIQVFQNHQVIAVQKVEKQ